MGLPRSVSYLHEILNQYDRDGDGSIDWWALLATAYAFHPGIQDLAGHTMSSECHDSGQRPLVSTPALSSHGMAADL